MSSIISKRRKKSR